MNEINYTFRSVIAALAFLLIVFIVAVIAFRKAENPAETVVAVMGVFTGVIGTLVGYVAGQSGKDKAQARAVRAERQMAAVLDTCAAGTLDAARKAHPDRF